jgi:hypothetical protein
MASGEAWASNGTTPTPFAVSDISELRRPSATFIEIHRGEGWDGRIVERVDVSLNIHLPRCNDLLVAFTT